MTIGVMDIHWTQELHQKWLEAWQPVVEYTQSDSLRRHMLAVEAAMRHYAEMLGAGAELLGLPLDEHIAHVITAMQKVAGPLGLEGR
jgi:predicted hydrolase (HD superfamily)